MCQLAKLGLEDGALVVREGHREESFGIADEPIHVALAGHLLHDALLVVVAQRAAQLVVVHRRAVLLDAPTPRNLSVPQSETTFVVLIVNYTRSILHNCFIGFTLCH